MLFALMLMLFCSFQWNFCDAKHALAMHAQVRHYTVHTDYRVFYNNIQIKKLKEEKWCTPSSCSNKLSINEGEEEEDEQ